MERVRRSPRVSSPPATKLTTVVDRRSDDRLVTVHWKGRQKRLPQLNSGSRSCSSSRAFAEEDLLNFERETKSAAGTPMKRLLADEMSKGNESRRRSPSIIARLMGLDGLPAQHNASKHQKRSADNHHQNAGSSGSRKSTKLYDSQTSWKDAGGYRLFRDVYEVAESPHKETRNHSSHATFSRNPSEDEIAFVRQKFMDVKRFSTDEKFQNSKEFHDALEVLDSNKDLLLKFLQEPNSMFAKHLRDLHGIPESHCVHVLSMKSADTLKCNIDAIGCHSGGKASRKIDISYSQKQCGSGYYNNLRRRRNIDSHKFNRLAEDKEDSESAPTRIVVLKPNLGKVQSTARSMSSPSPSSDSISDLDLHNECPNIMPSGSEKRGKRGMHKDVDIYECKYRESREIAREITRRMKNKLGTDSFNVSSTGYKGYSADESSREVSENESSYESEVTFASCRTSCSRSTRNSASTLNHEQSSVNMEAKRRLSERWKMTCGSREFSASGRGSTLAEMLAIPDMDIRPRNVNDIVAQDECFPIARGNDGNEELKPPLGISSRDGWKEGCIRNLARSRSLPSSSSYPHTPKSNSRRQTLATQKYLSRQDNVDYGRSKTLKRGSKRNEGSFAASPRPSNKKPEISYPISMEIIDELPGVHINRNKTPKSLDSENSPECKGVLLEVSSGRTDSDLLANPVMDKECENVAVSLNCTAELIPLPHRSSNTTSQDDLSTCEMQSIEQELSANCEVRDASFAQCAAIQPESPVSSKESEQPSPVSVIEAAFAEDASSGSECFERVSAELHGLRMQLQLLKLESETSQAYDEGSMVISSDEDGEELTTLHEIKGFIRAGESWASCYLADVLTESGLDESNPDMFIATWHCPDCPIGTGVFENLERKYSGEDSCSKSERRQLFDSINSRIIEISQCYVDPHPWTKSLTGSILPSWQKNGLRIELQKLLEVLEKKVLEVAADEDMLGGMKWMELGNHIDAVGREIEVLLIEELVSEIII